MIATTALPFANPSAFVMVTPIVNLDFLGPTTIYCSETITAGYVAETTLGEYDPIGTFSTAITTPRIIVDSALQY